MEVRNSVKCIAAGHARENQAGVVQSTDGKDPPKKVTVKWDSDQAEELLAVGDLVQLGSN